MTFRGPLNRSFHRHVKTLREDRANQCIDRCLRPAVYPTTPGNALFCISECGRFEPAEEPC